MFQFVDYHAVLWVTYESAISFTISMKVVCLIKAFEGNYSKTLV